MDCYTLISSLAVIITIGFTLYKYFDSRKMEQNLIEFKNYHGLIKALVQPDQAKENIYLDRQIAIIYELRNYKRYYPVTKRVLQGLKIQWKDGNNRLLEEIKLTLDYIKDKHPGIN